MSSNYINNRGYVITKNTLSDEDVMAIKQELTVTPFTIDGYGNTKAATFKTYMESNTKLYIPKYFGLQRFGLPHNNKIQDGDDICVKFEGNLRPLQEDAVKDMLMACRDPVKMGGLLCLQCGEGKCLAKNTKILMFDGTIKYVQDVQIGDKIMGDDSTPRHVLSTCTGNETMFKVIPAKGDPYIVNESHILSLKSANGDIVDISIKDYLKLPKKKTITLVGYRVPIMFPSQKIDLDPYVLGYLFGNKTNASFENDNIPHIYKCNSRDVRLHVLAGILDACGRYTHNAFHVEVQSEKLIDDVIYIARSLGFAAYKHNIQMKGKCFYTSITGQGIERIPTKILQNKAIGNHAKDVLLSRIKLEKQDVGEYYGFEIDGNRRFVLGDFTVTHNTVCGIKLFCMLSKKTLIVVHKEFLLDQWKERILEFAPSAKVGLIKAKTIDVDNKDIVIASLQSLAMKDYDTDVLSRFGCVIIDECYPYQQNIVTDVGPMHIGKVVDMWLNKKSLPNVLSFDRQLNTFTWKPVTYAWKKPYKGKMMKITFSQNSIVCTPDHKHLSVNNKMILTKDLKVGDLIISCMDDNISKCATVRSLNDDQFQVLIGCVLGCGLMTTLTNGRFKLRVIHECNHKEYCEWKASMFGVSIQLVEKNRYATLSTKEIDLSESPYIDNNKSRIAQWCIDALDDKGLAVWFMDNGIIDQSVRRMTIDSNSFDEDTHVRLVQKLEKEMNIRCCYNKGSKGKFQLILNEEGTYELLRRIMPYIHESMRYKIINNVIFKKYDWNMQLPNYGTQKITNISEVSNNDDYDKENVYDIEVADTHTFVCCSETSTCGIVTSNCHHLGAQVFSQALKKCNFKYSIGLTATPKRKDGLTKVFTWFIGDIVYQSKKRKDELVVNFKIFYAPDPNYSKEHVLWNQKPNVSRMINAICDYMPRVDFLIKELQSVLSDEPNRHILILSDRRQHLHIIKEHLDKVNIQSGFYYGGMSQSQLKESEEKQVLLATYQYASEGFDMKGLDTLILASPKSDVIQVVGRILRDKPENRKHTPLVMDIVDNFSMFPRQAEKRFKYYKSCKYDINGSELFIRKKNHFPSGSCSIKDI